VRKEWHNYLAKLIKLEAEWSKERLAARLRLEDAEDSVQSRERRRELEKQFTLSELRDVEARLHDARKALEARRATGEVEVLTRLARAITTLDQERTRAAEQARETDTSFNRDIRDDRRKVVEAEEALRTLDRVQAAQRAALQAQGPAGNVPAREDRLREVERKLDRLLKVIERRGRPSGR
jgi:hypothetical protein